MPFVLIGQAENYDLLFPYKAPISEISLDEEGYLWLHDSKDFRRFNGHQFEEVGLSPVMQSKNHDYNMRNRIIFSQDSLYFTYGNNVAIVHPKTSKINEIWTVPDNYYLSYLYQDELGHLWVFTASWNNLNRPVFKSENGRNFRQVLDLNDIIGDRSILWDFSELGDKEGTLYFQWKMGDLLLINSKGKEVELDLKDPLEFESSRACSQFRLDNNKNLWRIYKKNFQIYNPITKVFDSHSVGGKIEFVTNCKIENAAKNNGDVDYDVGAMLNLKTLLEDSKGRIWMACASSFLVCYDPSNDRMFNFRREIVEGLEGGNSEIMKIMEDVDNNIWGVNGGGLFKIRDQINYFDKFLVNTSDLKHNIYTENQQDPTLTKALRRYGNYIYKNTAVQTIEEDSLGAILFQSDILSFRLSGEDKIEILPLYGPKESVFLSYNDQLKLYAVWNSYYKIEEDFQLTELDVPILKIEDYVVRKNGDVWLAGLLDPSNYLFGKINPDTYQFEGNYQKQFQDTSFLMRKVNSMTEDEDGNFLLGTTNGLMSLKGDDEVFKLHGNRFFFKDDSIQIGQCLNQVNGIDDNDFWFLTKYEIGLANLKEKSIKHLLGINENWDNQDISFLNYGDSVIWLAHNDGIFYHNFNQDYSLNISSDKGLDNDTEILNLKKLSTGKIAVGTSNGLYVFHPDKLLRDSKLSEAKEKKYPLQFESYSVIDGKTDSLTANRFMEYKDETIVFNYNDKILSFNFGLLNYNYPMDHTYRYKLDGYDSNWTNPSNVNSVIYTSLPSGNYNLMVQASGTSGVWSETVLNIPVIVKEAWFRTFGFIFLCSFLLGGTIFFLSWYYYNQKLNRRKEIEQLRLSISHDLHDDVGSILAGLAMRSEVLSFKKNPKEKEELMNLAISSRTAMGKMRDIVWAMDPSRDRYENLIDRMKGFAIEQTERVEMGYHFDVQGIERTRSIKPNVKQNIYLIFKEALTNALKHSDGNMVFITLKNDQGKGMVMSVRDNGSKKLQTKTEGVGLVSIKRRAEKIGAKLEILELDGYEVRLTIPV